VNDEVGVVLDGERVGGVGGGAFAMWPTVGAWRVRDSKQRDFGPRTLEFFLRDWF